MKIKPVRIAISLLVMMSGSGHAYVVNDPGATVKSNAFARVDGVAPYVVPAACTSNVSGGVASNTLSLNCANAAGATTANVTFHAQATGPTSLTDLAAVRAQVSVDATLNSGAPANAPRFQYVTAQVTAGYVDYIKLSSVATDHLTLSFKLTGSLAVNDPLQNYATPAGAHASAFVYARAGVHYADGSFGSFAPVQEGASQVDVDLAQGGTPTTTVTNQSFNVSGYSFQQVAADTYSVTLGSAFFSNPANTDLRLEFALSAWAKVFAPGWGANGAMQASADYSHTLQMTAINAYDAGGNDITAQKVLGFYSSSLPQGSTVPEPGTLGLLATGLLMLAAHLAPPRQRGQVAVEMAAERHAEWHDQATSNGVVQ